MVGLQNRQTEMEALYISQTRLLSEQGFLNFNVIFAVFFCSKDNCLVLKRLCSY